METIEMISSECKRVLKLSVDRDALEEAHSVSITQEESWKLVYSYIDEDELPHGLTFENGRSYHTEAGGYINLNPNRLSVGLVLHETAHVIAGCKKMKDGRRDIHGPHFVKKLDELVASEREWAINPYEGNLW